VPAWIIELVTSSLSTREAVGMKGPNPQLSRIRVKDPCLTYGACSDPYLRPSGRAAGRLRWELDRDEGSGPGRALEAVVVEVCRKVVGCAR
jgi:hypothetical protein